MFALTYLRRAYARLLYQDRKLQTVRLQPGPVQRDHSRRRAGEAYRLQSARSNFLSGIYCVFFIIGSFWLQVVN